MFTIFAWDIFISSSIIYCPMLLFVKIVFFSGGKGRFPDQLVRFVEDLNGARGVESSSLSDRTDWHALNRRTKVTPKKRSKKPKDDAQEVKEVHRRKKKRLTVRPRKGESLISVIICT